ncbi:MAG: F0F1 ATP synthase subunit A [Cytophagales bacterium]|nr:F0F1 ATP synthase subunit A [Cytophagales bacterium]
MKITKKLTAFNHLKINSSLISLILLTPIMSLAEESEEGKEYNPSETINHHISDSHSWEIYHGLTVHLPVIVYSEEKGMEVFSSANFYDEHHAIVPYSGYEMDHEHIKLESGGHVWDFSITKNVFFLLLNTFLIVFVFISVAKGYKKNEGKAPKGIQAFFEPLIVFVRDDIAKDNIGPKHERYLPFLLTAFFFIWFGNMMGLLPAAANLTGNIAVTMVLAVIVLVITVFSGGKTYWLHILDPLGNSMPWAGKILLYVILLPVEILGIFTKPFALMIRLFANITAGHILILSIIGLGFMMESVVVGAVGALFASLMNLLEVFVALLQAYVFTLLSAMYFGQAVEEHH